MRRFPALFLLLACLSAAACGEGGAGAGSPGVGDDDDDDDGANPTPTPQGVELNPGWIGGACSAVSDCDEPGYSADPVCETDGFPNGFCTQEAPSGFCPDADTSSTTPFTVTRAIDADGEPRCVAECDFDKSPTGCRPDYTCVLRQRFNQPSTIFPVCLPDPIQRWPGEPAPANDIGAACNGDSSCGSLECLPLNGGYCTKSMCDLAGCPDGSSCFEFEGGASYCLKDCTSSSQCRAGYACDGTYDVCWPDPTVPPWDSSVGAAACADAWGAGLSPCDVTPDDYVVVSKGARNLALCEDGSLVQNWNIGLGFTPIGDKGQEGDGRTPEGTFYVPRLVPNSQFYKAFLLSYPDPADAAAGYAAGLISLSQKNAIDAAHDNCTEPPQQTPLGGLIEIHGGGGGEDWTFGCIAIDDSGIDTLWSVIGVGETIIVTP